MKYLKMLGLAVVAAAALSAFMGAGSASATVLCTTNSTPCGTSHTEGTKEGMYPAESTFVAHLKEKTKAVLQAGIFTVECEGSTAEMASTTTGSKAWPSPAISPNSPSRAAVRLRSL
jgi:hypothetical protein